MATMEDEQELWDRLRRGDTEAFGGFYRQHATRLQGFLRHAWVMRRRRKISRKRPFCNCGDIRMGLIRHAER